MSINSSGYLIERVAGKVTYVHRNVWEKTHGPIPSNGQIDHINGDKLDNRLENLRLSDNSSNNCNVALRADNLLGHKGISVHKGAYRVQVAKRGHKTVDRRFYVLAEAVQFAKETRNALHGDFAHHG